MTHFEKQARAQRRKRTEAILWDALGCVAIFGTLVVMLSVFT